MKKILLILTILAMTVCMCSCGKKGNEVNIAYFDNITHGQALYMIHENTLQERLGDEIEVNWTAFTAGSAEVEACFAGDIDIGYIGPVPAVTAYTKTDGTFVIISAATNSGAILIARADSDIESVEDLDGKKVAIPQLGNTQHLLLLDLLTSAGLSPSTEGGTVDVIATSNSNIANYMDLGEVDAALVPEPWGTTILKSTNANVIMDYDEINNGEQYSTALVIVNKNFMEDNPDIVQAFLEEHINATEYICQYPDEACKIMNAQLLEDTGKALDEEIITEAIGKIEYSVEIPEGSVKKYADISLEQEFIDGLPDDNIFQNALLQDLLK